MRKRGLIIALAAVSMGTVAFALWPTAQAESRVADHPTLSEAIWPMRYFLAVNRFKPRNDAELNALFRAMGDGSDLSWFEHWHEQEET